MQPESSVNSREAGRLVSGHVVRRDAATVVSDIADVPSQILTVFLAGIAILVHAIVVAEGEYDASFYGWFAAQLCVLLFGAWWFRRQAARMGSGLIVSPLLVAAGLFALLWEWGTRSIWGSGQAFEVVTMTVIRNLVLGLAMVSVWPAHQRLAIALSLFLAMFGVTASQDVAAQWLVGLFAVGAVCWLVASHWENIRRRLHGRERSNWPRWAILVPVGVLLAVAIGTAGADRRVANALSGFLPSSGGTGDSDPYARDGVGDGDMLVAGSERIQTFAPIDDAPFAQDDKPSLYDLFDDSYEEEVTTTRTDRAIALPPDLANRAREHIHSRTEKANRQFSTLRRPSDTARRRHVSDIRSRAAFYVAGRVPLHLRLQVYDLFDGETWYPEESQEWQPSLKMSHSEGKSWLRLRDRGGSRSYLGPAETHALKIVRLDTNVIPAPLYLHGVHIELIDRADMFTHGPDGLVAMDRKSLPTLVPIHLASRAIDWDVLQDAEKLFLPVPGHRANSVIPTCIDQTALKRLADRWCQEADTGGGQVAAIVNRLKNQYRLDPDWRPETGKPGVEQFLFESRRGPDYQFATAAALLLRALGYSTRVVGGFYADPDRYDSKSRHTPVFDEDVHFWTEVRVSGGDWITVDATPGYSILGPPPGLLARLGEACANATRFAVRQSTAISILLLIGALVSWKRRRLADQWNTARWWLEIQWSPASTVESTLRLLRQRALLAGCPPRLSTTHHQWLGGLIDNDAVGNEARWLDDLRREIDVAAYSSDGVQLTESTKATCREVVRTCTLGWFEAANDGDRTASRIPSKTILATSSTSS